MTNRVGTNPIFIDTGSSVPQLTRGVFAREIHIWAGSKTDGSSFALYNAKGTRIAYYASMAAFTDYVIAPTGRMQGIWAKATGGTVGTLTHITIFEE